MNPKDTSSKAPKAAVVLVAQQKVDDKGLTKESDPENQF